MRIKARALGLPAEEYFNDHVLEDTDLLYSGIMQLPDDFWLKHGKGMESWQENKQGSGYTFYRISGPLVPSMLVNQFVFMEPKNGEPVFYGHVTQINGKTAVIQTLRDYGHAKNSVWGITARNREQNFALNMLMDPECDFVTLLGQAGTGKTLLALAAGLSKVLDQHRYRRLLVTRPVIPMGKDVGYLPGDKDEKLRPWMQPIYDNLEYLMGCIYKEQMAADMIRHIQDKGIFEAEALTYIRGRSIPQQFIIVDEAQNLTPHEVKTIVSRAGEGTKIVLTGDPNQIDHPYLDFRSNGLCYAIEKFKDNPLAGHVTLTKGQRSELAELAAKLL
jgi:PhoH-like ATPase